MGGRRFDRLRLWPLRNLSTVEADARRRGERLAIVTSTMLQGAIPLLPNPQPLRDIRVLDWRRIEDLRSGRRSCHAVFYCFVGSPLDRTLREDVIEVQAQLLQVVLLDAR